MSPKLTITRGVWAALALFILSFLYFLSYAGYGVNLLDEGYLFNPALRILKGELPGKDYYHFYPPGRFYFLAVAFKIFGPGILVGRITLAMLHAVESVLAWKLTSRLISPKWAIIAWLGILICPGPAHKVFFGLSVLTVLLTLEWAMRTAYKRGWLIYGITLGLMTLVRHDVAAFGAILGIAAAVLKNRDKEPRPRLPGLANSFSIILGLFVAIVPPYIYWASKGILGEIIYQMVVAARKGNQANAIPFPLPLEIFSGGLSNGLRVLLYYLPIVTYVAGAIYLIRLIFRPEKGDLASEVFVNTHLRTIISFILIMGVFCLNQARVRSDLPHLYQAVVPIFVLVPALCYHAFRSRWGVVLAAVPLILAASQTFAGNAWHHGTPVVARGRNVRVELTRGHLMLSKPEADQLEGLLEFINEHSGPGQNILVLPAAPLIYFLAERPNPTPYELMRMGRFDTPESQRKVVETLRNRRPALVVYQNQSYLPVGRRFEDYAPLIETFIRKNYQQTGVAVTFDLLLPKNEKWGQSPFFQ